MAVDVAPELRPSEVHSDATTQSQPESPAAPTRIVSLDVVRGLMLIVSVGVNSWVVMPAWFDHAKWIGIHPLDWVFPTFVTLSGCGMACANAKRVRLLRPVIQRALILFAFGLVYNWVEAGSTFPPSLSTARIPGVLQLYAFVVLVIAGLHVFVKGWRNWALITLLLALADSALIGFWGSTCAAGHVTPTCNPSHAIDFAVFGAPHLLASGTFGYDPEGFVGIFGALVSASLGATVGHVLLAGRKDRSRLRAAMTVIALALCGLAMAKLLGSFVPAFKNQWTAPFALLVSSVAALVLAGAHLLVDRRGVGSGVRLRKRGELGAVGLARGVQWPLVALGRNSLFVYFGSHALTAYFFTHGGLKTPWMVQLERHVTVLGHPQASVTLLLEAVWISLACLLHWRRIYLRP